MKIINLGMCMGSIDANQSELDILKNFVIKNKAYLENEYNKLVDIMDIIKEELECNDIESILMIILILHHNKK